uniref:Fructokinase 2 n=1 Tax=Solanum tuberosum TaxID=4113 RepID=M1CKJ7_SOLTU
MQDKAAFIFCVEDRALFCKDCDEAIHSASSLAKNHQRFLATGIRVALSSSCNKEAVKNQLEPQPPQQNSQQVGLKMPTQQLSGITSPSWPVDDLLGFPDYESSDKVKKTYSFYILQVPYVFDYLRGWGIDVWRTSLDEKLSFFLVKQLMH